MKTLLIAAVVAVIALALISAALKEKKPTGEKPRAKRLMTPREQAMHNRLTQALPDFVVLAQVSFGALLTAKTYASRNRFDRKIADFVICDKAFQVTAVIELDDASHKTKRDKDSDRDAMLQQAGYRVIRYANIPDIDKVQADFAPPPLTASATPSTSAKDAKTIDELRTD